MKKPEILHYVPINSIRTLLNGETLMKLQAFNTSSGSQESFNEPEVVHNSGNSSTALNPLQKGLKSLDNPVLRGSFSLVLTEEKLNSLEEIARKSFREIMSEKLTTVTTASPVLRTIHLKTDLGKVQNKRPGVYVIKNKETGACIVGQTKDLRKRFNQYTSRSQLFALDSNKINKNFYIAVQEAINKGLDYSQVFQRFVVYTWVDKEIKALDVQNSLLLKNEMNYLEHRLLLAFFECGFAYNIEDVAPQLTENVTLPPPTGNVSSQPLQPRLTTGHVAKPFRIDNRYFQSSADYEKFRKSLDSKSRRDFLSMPSLRTKLKQNVGNLTCTTRYLTEQETKDASKKDLFYKPN